MPGLRSTTMRALTASALAVGAAVALSTPAMAHPVVEGPLCTNGLGTVECQVDWFGEPDPVVRWTLNGVVVPGTDGGRRMSAWCTGTQARVRVTLTFDDYSLSRQQTLPCLQ